MIVMIAAVGRRATHDSIGGESWVIGGGQVYAMYLAAAGRLELTLVDVSPEGDAHFPDWHPPDRSWS